MKGGEKGERPRFSANVVKVTGEGEQVTVGFFAETEGELQTRLAEAARVLSRRLKSNNDEILNVREQVTAAALAGGRQRREAGNGGASAGSAHS